LLKKNHDLISLCVLLQFVNASCDYTSPQYITLMLTDRGMFTPTDIADELVAFFK
jgi:translation initiation factor 2B subunit (eIF-2B alpha/beta/delta family)